MATLVLTAVGTFVGGPIGGAIGSLIGQAVDSRVFAPKAVHGPRLKELSVQTSQYGTAIPALFGRMRVAGTVIWSTDLIESKTKTGQGKGRPASVQYSYRASFAVALSSRRALRLGRIWADGTLIREEGGALSSGGVLRFYTGAGDQMPDPLIAADVDSTTASEGQCPAYRGLAYAVLEDMPLADFGNRIPSLTFEVIADEGPVSLDTIARYGSGGVLTAPDSSPLIGYAAEGADLDSWLAPLIAAEGRVLARTEEGFALLTPAGAPIALPDDRVTMLGTTQQEDGRASLPPIAAASPPMALRYYDAARDYQIAVQASTSGDFAQPVESRDLPAVLSAEAAAALIHRIAAHSAASAQQEERVVPEEWADTLPIGALYRIAGGARTWQILEREWLDGAVRLTARAFHTATATTLSGDSGTHIGSSLAAIGATRLLAIELPSIPNVSTTAFLTAAGEGSGWRGAMAYAEVDGMAQPLGWVGRGAMMGESATPLPAHHGLLSSPNAMLDIDLLHADMALPSATTGSGALLWLNGEIIGFTAATPIGTTRWRLTGLSRGLYNSARTTAHPVGSAALLLDEAMPHWPLALSTVPIGASLTYNAEGANDDPPVSASLSVQHRAARPPAPVHGRWRREGTDIRLDWTRRSRSFVPWQDYLDTPLGEGAERYHISAGDAAWDCSTANISIARTALSQGGGGAVSLFVRQIGDGGASDPLHITIPAAALA